MDAIFGFIGNIFGYVLWFLYEIVRNYGVAIIIFTLISKLILLPFSVKQQKTIAKNSSLASKQNELKKKYGNNREKLNEEMTKLYKEEGISPTGGCSTMLAPFIIMFGVFYVVRNPLSNALHIATDKVSEALALLQKLPGVGVNFSSRNLYGEIDVIKNFNVLRDNLTMFDSNDISNINFFSDGFNFLGLDLLGTPSQGGFASPLILIPILCLVSSLVSQFIIQKMTGQAQQQEGCMKFTMYLLPLVSVYFSYIVPAAVGFYWIASTLLSLLQSVVLNKFYSAGLIKAKEEAARVALREIQEKNM